MQLTAARRSLPRSLTLKLTARSCSGLPPPPLPPQSPVLSCATLFGLTSRSSTS